MNNTKTDLRIVKTKANIKREFMALLQKKSVDKITVTELAQRALINKGTFYLHYQDIYILYEEVIHDAVSDFCNSIDFYEDFFEAPEDFAAKIMTQLRTGPLERLFPHMDPLATKVPLPIILADELKAHLYQVGVLTPSITNDIKLEYVLLSLFTISFRYSHEHFSEASQTVALVIKSLFAETQ